MLNQEIIDEIAEDDSQVFDFHECSIRQKWVKRLADIAMKARDAK